MHQELLLQGHQQPHEQQVPIPLRQVQRALSAPRSLWMLRFLV